MRVTMDRVGRVVIRKQLRVALGIDHETELEIVPDGNGPRLEQDGLPLPGPVGGAVLTDDDVRRLRHGAQR